MPSVTLKHKPFLTFLLGFVGLNIFISYYAFNFEENEVRKVKDKFILKSRTAKSIVRSATFVTALYDINRNDWAYFSRSFNSYINYFNNILDMNSNLVLYCEHSTWTALRLNSAFLTHPNISVNIIPFEQLEYYEYYYTIKAIMKSNEFKENNQMLNHPEAFSPEYIILMSNKFSFMKTAVEKNPFGSTHYFWIDAGYGHGDKTHFPPQHSKWQPQKLLKLDNTITYISFEHDPYVFKGNEKDIYKKNVGPILNGAFFGGDRSAVLEYANLYKTVFIKFLNLYKIVDDDQNIAIFSFYERPKLFNLVRGGWYDVIKLFS